jgi:hypothetical protein
VSRLYKEPRLKNELSCSKVELDVTQVAHGLGEASFSAIVKVSRPDYVPDCVSVRVRLNAQLFTAQITPPALKLLEQDPLVVSISINKLLRTG